MNRRTLSGAGLLAGILIAAALSIGHGASAPRSPARGVGQQRSSALSTPAAVAPVHATLKRGRPRRAVLPLSVAQLAGQRIVYAYSGLTPPPSLLTAIRAGEAGGVIFFAPNISSPGQLGEVISRLQRASRASPVHTGLLMLIDQEGGQVRRLPGAPGLSEKQVGESSDAIAAAASAGAGAARVLRGASLNVNLAPVLDVYRRPGNFIDAFQRSYSSQPRTVATLGAAFIAAQQRAGVAATAKHFPGLGSAGQSQNTDLGPVTLQTSLASLRAHDEAPYGKAVAAGVKLVMTSWAIYPALDRGRPAGMSAAVIQGELRGRLGFRGVTITDGIDAGAATPFGSLGRRAVLAAAAGADLILCATTNPNDNTPTQGIIARTAIASALAAHHINRAAALRAATRILALRAHP